MTQRRLRLRRRASARLARPLISAALVVCLAIGAGAVRQQPAARPPMAEEVFKNIQVLKGIPVDEFMGTMGFFASAVGLNCTDCHVDESGGNWARYADDNALKQRTRQMIVMMNTINRTNFGGRQVVTCNTCHRGTPKPNVMPSLDALYGEPPPDEPGDPFEQAPGQPPAEQILDRYLAAIGGAERVAALRSLTGKGTYIGFDDPGKSPMELYARAPGQRATIVHGFSGDTTSVVDGRSAWIAAPPTDRPVPLLTLTGQELEGVSLEAKLLFPARIRELLTKWRVGVPAVLGDRDVNVVQGTAAGGAVVTLCFDAETGLLVRMVRYAVSPVGRLVTRVDYGGYREVGGVRMPFRWTVSWLSGRSTYELTEVQPNVQIPDARFAQPR
jgi:outer membrane lipoprotein-sorting protein